MHRSRSVHHKREVTSIELNNDIINEHIKEIEALKKKLQSIAIGGPVCLPKSQAILHLKSMSSLCKMLGNETDVSFVKGICKKIKECKDNYEFYIAFDTQKTILLDKLNKMKEGIKSEEIKDDGIEFKNEVKENTNVDKQPNSTLPSIHKEKPNYLLFYTTAAPKSIKLTSQPAQVRTHRRNYITILR